MPRKLRQPPPTPTDPTNYNQTDTMSPTEHALDAISFQASTISLFRTTRRVRKQPVKDYRTNEPLSKIFFLAAGVLLKSVQSDFLIFKLLAFSKNF